LPLEVSNRLKRLAEAGLCSCEAVSEYAGELQKLARKTLGAEDAKRKSKVFKALSDEIRLRILCLLSVREMCVCEVMAALNLTQPTASHHLGILENVDLVKGRKDGKWVFYSIANPELIREIMN
jgi:DNA-binding transcriptional ArsR family regulator